MQDFSIRPVSATRIGKCLPPLPSDASIEVSLLAAQYFEMFYGGSKEYNIPSIRRVSRMTPRQRKKFYVDGLHTTIGYDLTIEFGRELTKEDAPEDWWAFESDPRPVSLPEHQQNVANWFMADIEKHELYTCMGLPLTDPMKVKWIVSADHSGPFSVWQQFEMLLKFLRLVDSKDFVKSWTAQWYSLDHWSDKADNSYEFARMHKGDIPCALIPLGDEECTTA